MSDAAWHEWRRAGVGGSDIAGLLGLSNYTSPYRIWAEKVGLLEPTESTQRQRIGQRMEAVLAAEFNDETGLYVAGEQTWCQDPEAPWRRCTVDGFVFDRPLDLATFSFERWHADALATWEAKTDGRFGWPDGAPANIRAQCVWGLGVTQLDSCFLTVMFAGFRVQTFEIPWDVDAKADWELMCERADRFWHAHVLTGIPPPVDGSDATADALHTIWPDHVEGVAVELDDLADVLTERSDLKERLKADKARLAEFDNRIKARFGDAEVGTVGGVPILTYRTSEVDEYVVAARSQRTLRAAPRPKQRKGPA
jgi:putative phage-type endonuclease